MGKKKKKRNQMENSIAIRKFMREIGSPDLITFDSKKDSTIKNLNVKKKGEKKRRYRLTHDDMRRRLKLDARWCPKRVSFDTADQESYSLQEDHRYIYVEDDNQHLIPYDMERGLSNNLIIDDPNVIMDNRMKTLYQMERETILSGDQELHQEIVRKIKETRKEVKKTWLETHGKILNEQEEEFYPTEKRNRIQNQAKVYCYKGR